MISKVTYGVCSRFNWWWWRIERVTEYTVFTLNDLMYIRKNQCQPRLRLGSQWFSRGDNFPCYPLLQSIIVIMFQYSWSWRKSTHKFYRNKTPLVVMFLIKKFNFEENQHFDNLILKNRHVQHGLRRVTTENWHFYLIGGIFVWINCV